MKKANARTTAVRLLLQVAGQQESLTRVLATAGLDHLKRDRGLVYELVYGVLRWYLRLQKIQSQLVKKPLKAKDRDIELAVMLGLYQLMYMRIPPHAAVATAVEVTHQQGKSWASGLVNASLRNFTKNQEGLLASIKPGCAFTYAHPEWLCSKIRNDWPGHDTEILQQNNGRAPMWLRVNNLQSDMESYSKLLAEQGIEFEQSRIHTNALVLKAPHEAELLPGYQQGMVSVQDGASQLVVGLLDLHAGMSVLDACAAPGGKTAQILETCPELESVVAIDKSKSRLQQVTRNLERLQLSSPDTGVKAALECLAADASRPDQWAGDRQFDRILLDAPCSATGVIRRHPDIKLLRQEQDIARLADGQSRLLNALWPRVKPGGKLLYSTCSLLRQENSLLVRNFIDKTADCEEVEITADWGQKEVAGRQLLPGELQMDGFYFAVLQRKTIS